MTPRDYYTVLGVPPTASAEEIKAAYRALAKRLHPDVHPQQDRQGFQELVEAYRVLSEPASRRQYDLYRSFISSFSGQVPPDVPTFDWIQRMSEQFSWHSLRQAFTRFLKENTTGFLSFELFKRPFASFPIFIPLSSPEFELTKAFQGAVVFTINTPFFSIKVTHRALRRYEEALKALKQREYERAERLLLDVLDMIPEYLPAYMSLALIYRKTGATERAKSYYKKVYMQDMNGSIGQLAARYLRNMSRDW